MERLHRCCCSIPAATPASAATAQKDLTHADSGIYWTSGPLFHDMELINAVADMNGRELLHSVAEVDKPSGDREHPFDIQVLISNTHGCSER